MTTKNSSPLFTCIISLIFILFPISSFADDENCDDAIPKMEKSVIDIVTLYGQRWGLKNMTIGSYAFKNPIHRCEYHVLITYETEDSTPYTPDMVFRYFHLTPGKFPMTPPVSMHARKPIWENPNFKKIEPPYGCEERKELEDFHSNVFGIYPQWTASTVFPREKFPYCAYHIFTMEYSNPTDPENSEIIFRHFRTNETWEYEYPLPIYIKGRRIKD